ncbi:hypothetical protein C8Q79DRAFT_1007092 [Trametes meyenii]|nr:hypothetical protein C8Q79DRAFT_1007092 [Trametes meyenii]
MPAPLGTGPLRGRLSGQEVSEYFENFASKFLRGKIQFGKEVQRIRRHPSGEGWQIDLLDVGDGHVPETRAYGRVVLCTGGCSAPRIPEQLSPSAAAAVGFKGPVIHTAQFAAKANDLLSSCSPIEADSSPEDASVVVVGGGKSAQDMCAFLANEGRKVTLVCHNLDVFLASTEPLPPFIRKSRFLSLILPHIHLRTALERFLHTTWLGRYITRFAWKAIIAYSFRSANVPVDSPLRNTVDPFWNVRLNDEGVPRPSGFHALALAGKIDDGQSVVLDDGRIVRVSAVVLDTGYKSSWEHLFGEKDLNELGLGPQPAALNTEHHWDYTTLLDPPPTHPDTTRWSSGIYRGLVPAKNITRRDLAVFGTGLTTNIGYTSEVVSHWISSYFLGDRMRIPDNVEAAIAATEREAAWLKQRFPQVSTALNPSYTAFLSFLKYVLYSSGMGGAQLTHHLANNWSQYADDLLVVDLDELKNLKEERDARRAALERPY